MIGTPEQILAARNAWLAARDAWFAAMAAHEALRLEVNRLWLEYLELADPVGARKFRRFLMKETAKTANELYPETTVSLERSIRRRNTRLAVGQTRLDHQTKAFIANRQE